MRRRRWLAGALLTAALLLGSVQAGAAPVDLSMAEYQALLRQTVTDLEAGRGARFESGTEFVIQTPDGPVAVDLSPLQQGSPTEALKAARLYLQAAEGSPAAAADPGARGELAQILASQKTRGKIAQWIANLLERLLLGGEKRGGVLGVLTDERTPWIAGSIGLIGIGLLAFYLFRGLRGHGAGADLAAKLGRGPRPERPLTPDQRLDEARALAAAGDWTAALRGGYLALLHALDKQGLIRYVPAQTNREHERQLRRSQPGLAPAFANLTALVESRLFGGIEATADDFAAGSSLIEQLWREGDALSRRADATTGASSSAPSR